MGKEAGKEGRQELGRELETMRREKVERDKMIDMRMKMMEIDAAKNKNKQELLAKKEEVRESENSHARGRRAVLPLPGAKSPPSLLPSFPPPSSPSSADTRFARAGD